MALIDNINAYYKFDASSSADNSGNGFTGTDTSITYNSTNGKINVGAGFGGSSKVAVTMATGLGSSFTFTAWVYITTTGLTQCIINSNVASYSNYWAYFYINGTQKLAFDMFDGTNNPNMVSTASLSANTWYHVAAVRDVTADKMRLYINGASAATEITDTTTSTPTYSAMGIGRRTNDTDGITGRIDEVGIWSRALTSTEISTLYGSGYGLSYPFSSVNTLVVAGGGGGGTSNRAGGGGAGGYQANTSFTVTAQAYSITVGGGGAINTNGSNSVFDTITAIGGGSGGNRGVAGSAGGSGGGSGSASSAAGGSGSQGNNGGTNTQSLAAAGGGGAGSAGGNDSATNIAGNGGNGIANSISGASVTYAGGGGGGGDGAKGTGGTGGGGDGGTTSLNAVAGTANTGGGGGGGGDSATSNSAAGGSGIVIISFPTDGSTGVSTSSTGGTITTSGGNQIHTFTSSGTWTMVAAGGGSVFAPRISLLGVGR